MQSPSLRSASVRNKRSHNRQQRRMIFESLEDRQLMATLTTGDAVVGSAEITYSVTAGDNGMAALFEQQLTRAFERSSNLANYAPQQLIDTAQWVLKLDNTATEAQLFDALGAANLSPTNIIPNTYYYTIPAGTNREGLGPVIQATPGVKYAYPLVTHEVNKRFVPNDPLYSSQWHLNNTGQTGGTANEDANVETAWDVTRGTGVVIGIVDDGVQHTHPDLVGHYLANLAIDLVGGDNDPMGGAGDFHGTAVAGVATANTNNSLGVAGAAPDARFTGIRLLGANQNDSTEAQAILHQLQSIHIYNNSWGPPDGYGGFDGTGPLMTAALQQAITAGRGGLGNLQIWAGGNGGTDEDNSNYDGYANSWYTTAIGALDHTGNRAPYSEPGANILVTTYSLGAFNTTPGITTTDIVGADGYNFAAGAADGDGLADLNYTSEFSGTSSSSPLAAGITALILSANPNLTWRDVNQILLQTARQNDPSDPDWTVNGAGYLVNHNYGFGSIDATAAVNLARTWTNLPAATAFASAPVTVNAAIPDNNAAGVQFTANIAQDIRIEQIELVTDITHAFPEDLEITLTSPDGTVSNLANPHTAFFNTTDQLRGWSFTSVRHWGELARGTWTVTVRDRVATQTGTFNNFRLNILGTTVVPSANTTQLEGQVFADTNANGTQDTGEPGLGGITVFLDNNSNGVLDGGEQQTITTNSGLYAFPNLTAGNYVVDIVQPAQTTLTAPSLGNYTVTAIANQTVTVPGFGLLASNTGPGTPVDPPPPPPPPPFQFSGVVGNDLNANGQVDSGEPGVGNAIVYLDINNDGKLGLGEPAQTTNSYGQFGFSVAPGSYILRQAGIPGWAPSAPSAGFYSVSGIAGEVLSGFFFGNLPSVDHSDAPASYGAASHSLIAGFYLGASVDGEEASQPSSSASGDDSLTSDDEDGVRFVSAVVPGQTATVDVTVHNGTQTGGMLHAWVDFNDDGDFADAGERIFSNLRVNNGVNRLTFPVPAGAALGEVISRFRYGYGNVVGPTGPMMGGEVEDHALTIVATKPTARPDDYVILPNSSTTSLAVLANDLASSLGSITIVSATQGSLGGTVVNNGQTLLYTPKPGVTNGVEVFSYTVSDGQPGGTATAQVSVTLGTPPVAPVAIDDSYRVGVNTVSSTFNVRANDQVPQSAITSVIVNQATGKGGYVAVNAGSLTLRYTPPFNYVGVDQFQYTIRDARGLESTATVTVHVGQDAIDDLAGLQLTVTDVLGAPITDVPVGSEFQVHILTLDKRTTPTDPGVIAAYLDVLYSQGLVAPKAANTPYGIDVAFNVAFDQARSGAAPQPGLLNELGAARSTVPTSIGPTTLMTITFVAQSTGTVTFTADPADATNNTVRMGSPVASINIDKVTYGTTSINVVAAAPLRNATNHHDVNGDGRITPLDALMVINAINRLGSASLVGRTVSPTDPAYLDVSGDDRLSPLDALMVINYLNSGGRSQGESSADGNSQAEPDEDLIDMLADDVASQWN